MEAVTVRIPPETKQSLDAIAKATDRDRSYVVNEALQSYIEIFQWQVDHIQQGLKEIEAGDSQVKRKWPSPGAF